MIDEIKIGGMGCAHCVTAVKEALGNVDGVEVQEVEIGSARVRLESEVQKAQVDSAIRAAGYEPQSHSAAEGAA